MFKINHRPEFTRDVKIRTPEGDGTREDIIKATFVVLDDDALSGFNVATLDGQKDMLRACVTHLDGILDDDDKPIPYTPGLLEQVMGNSFARLALQKTYSDTYVERYLGN